MKRIYMNLTFLCLPLLTMAQSRIAYAYDASGNRVKREIIMQLPKAKQQTFETEGQVFSDMLQEHDVKIYPNPTDGILKVSISGIKNTDKCSLAIYTLRGDRIMLDERQQYNFDVNISNQPAGTYLLRITINNQSTTWKIIKK